MKCLLISILFVMLSNFSFANDSDGNYQLKLNSTRVDIVGFKGWVLNTHVYPSDKQINFNVPAKPGEGTPAYPDLTISEQESGGSVRLYQIIELFQSIVLPNDFILKPKTFEYKSRKYLEVVTQGSSSESQLLIISHSLLFEEKGKIFECTLHAGHGTHTKENINELLRLCSSTTFTSLTSR